MKRLSFLSFTLVLSTTALLSQITIVKSGTNGGNIGLGTLNPQEDIHLKLDNLLWQDKSGNLDYLTFQKASIPIIRVGGSRNARLLTRHLEGKHHRSANTSTLYLQYYADYPVILGRSNVARANNYLRVYGDIHSSGNIFSMGTNVLSDKNLKSNISPLRYGLTEVLQLSPVFFQYNGKMGTRKGSKHIGILAQNLKKITPELVLVQDYIEHDADIPEPQKKGAFLAVKDNEVKWLLVNAIKDLKAEKDNEINQLKDEISELRSLIKDLASVQTSSQDVHLQGEAFLGQNEPNPFNATTRIAYKLPDGISSGEIAFYGLDGSMLHTVQINDAQGNINLSQDDLPNGQYTYSLIVNGQVWDTKKMILQK